MNEIFSLDLGRIFFSLLLLILYFFLGFKTKKWFLVSSCFLLFILPFNLTLQLKFSTEYIQGISSNYLVPTLSILDIFVFLTLIFAFFKRNSFKKIPKIFFLTLLTFFLVKIFLDWNLVSSILVLRLYFYIFTAYILFQNVSFKKHINLFGLVLLVSVIIQFLVGLLQFRYGHSLGLTFLGESQVVKGMFGSSFVELNEVLFLRSYGTFPHPNILAGYLFLIVLFCMPFLKKKIFLITPILSTVLIFLTFSRITIFLVLILWLLFFCIKFFFKQKILLVYPLILTRFTNIFTQEDSSFFERMELVRVSKEVMKEYPYWGIGVGRFLYAIETFPVYNAKGFLLLQPVHNVFLLLLSEYGFVFGVPLLVFLLYLFIRAFQKGGWLMRFLVISIVIIASFDHYFITIPQGVFIFTGIMVFLYFSFQKTQKFHSLNPSEDLKNHP